MHDVGVEYEPRGIEFAAMDAQDDGREANEQGRPATDNPHRAGTRLHMAWSDGWDSAQTVREQWEADNHARPNCKPR